MFYVNARTADNQMDIKYAPIAYSNGSQAGVGKMYVRPLATIKASLFSNEGDGTKENPWKLEKKVNEPSLPEEETKEASITYMCQADRPRSEWGLATISDDVEFISVCKADNSFNDSIYTSNSFKLIGNSDQWGNKFCEGYNHTYSTRAFSIEFKVSCQKFATMGQGGFRIAVWNEKNGKFEYITSESGIDDTTHGIYLVQFPDAKERIVRIDLLDIFYGIAVNKSDINKITKTTRPSGKKVLFVGNSWTNGTNGDGNGRLYNSYVNVLSDALGFECINNGYGGTGYRVPTSDSNIWYSSRMEAMVKNGVKPDIIIVGGAGNDILGNLEPSLVAEELKKCIDKAKELNIKLIVIGVEKSSDDIRVEFTQRATPLNEALKKVALDNNVPYIDFLSNTSIAGNGTVLTSGKTPFVVSSEIGSDNLHPTLEGHKQIGLRLAEEVQAIVNYYKW